MSASRKKRKADGTLRPSVLRRRRRRRAAWLNEFRAGERKAFFDTVDVERALFVRSTARRYKISEEDAELILTHTAQRNPDWLRLTKRDGQVVGVGPRRAP